MIRKFSLFFTIAVLYAVACSFGPASAATWTKVGASGLAHVNDPRCLMSIWADDDGRIWGGLADGYMFMFDTATGAWQDIGKPPWWDSYKANYWPYNNSRGASSICDIGFNPVNRSVYCTASTGSKANAGFTGVWRYDTVTGQFIGKSSGDPNYPFLWKNGGTAHWNDPAYPDPWSTYTIDKSMFQYQALTVGPYGSVMFNGGGGDPRISNGGGQTDLWSAESAFWMHGEDADKVECLQMEGSSEYIAGAGPGCMFSQPINPDTCGCTQYLYGQATGPWRTGELNWVKARESGGEIGITSKAFLDYYTHSRWIGHDPGDAGGYNRMSYAACFDPYHGYRWFGGASMNGFSPLISGASGFGADPSQKVYGPSFAWPVDTSQGEGRYAEVGGMAADDYGDVWYGMGDHLGFDTSLWDRVYRIRTNPISNPGWIYNNPIDEGQIDAGKVIAVRDMVTVGGKQYALTISKYGEIALYTNGTGRYTPRIADYGNPAPGQEITALAAGSDSKIYGGTSSGQFFQFNPSTRTTVNMGQPGGTRINNMIAYGTAIYFGDNSGNLFRYNIGGSSTKVYDDPSDRSIDGQMTLDASGNIYFAVHGAVLMSYNTGTSTVTTLGTIPGGQNTAEGMIVANGKLWIGSDGVNPTINLASYTLPSGPFTNLSLASSLTPENHVYGFVVDNSGNVIGGTGYNGKMFSINTSTSAVTDIGWVIPNRLNPKDTPMYQFTRYIRPIVALASGEVWFASSPIWNRQAGLLSIYPGSALSPTNPSDLGQIRINSNYITCGTVLNNRLYFGTKWREGDAHLMSRSLSNEDLIAPHAPTNMRTGTGDSKLTVYWTNPGSLDITQTMIRVSTTTYPSTINDGTLVVQKSAVTYVDDNTVNTGLQNGVTYYYSAFTRDSAGNYSVAAHTTGVPHIDPVTNFTATGGFQTITLNWKNPSSTSFVGTKIVYRLDRFPTSPTDGTLVINKASAPGSNDSFVHTNLSNGITYYYAAFAYDAAPNYAVPANVQGMPVTPSPSNMFTNGDCEPAYSGGVANGWNKYNNISITAPSGYTAQTFYQDTSVVHKSTSSQATANLGTYGIPNNGTDYYVQSGIYQVVTAKPDKMYLMVGWQNLDSSLITGTAYYQQFGISPTGATTPGTPGYGVNAAADAVWLPYGESLWNNDTAGAAYVPGWKKLFSATPSAGSTISCWTGVGVRAKGNRTNQQNKMNIDENYLYELDAPVVTSLLNADMEGDTITLTDVGMFIPAGWQLVGGGIGTTCGYAINATGWLVSPHGTKSAQISNNQGKINAGLLQRVSTVAGQILSFSAYARAGQNSNDSATVVYVGIDPTGGINILSPNIVWSAASNIGGFAGWRQVSVGSVTAAGPVATVFLRIYSSSANTNAEHTAVFDDAAFSATPSTTSSLDFSAAADGTKVVLRNQIVTGAWSGLFYIEELDRTHGVKVVSGTPVAAGNAVDILGTVQTVGGERQITAQTVYVQSGVNLLPAPFAMSSKALGGKGIGNNPGIADSIGPYNIGLRVRVWGRVSSISGDTFTLTDGGDEYRVLATGLVMPSDGSFILVTGVSSTEPGSAPTNKYLRATSITPAGS